MRPEHSPLPDASVAFLKLQHSSQMLKHVPERMALNLLALLVRERNTSKVCSGKAKPERLGLTGERAVRYAQIRENERFFNYVTTVLYLSGLVRDHTGTFSWSEEPPSDQSPAQTLSEWQNYRTIPDNPGRLLCWSA